MHAWGRSGSNSQAKDSGLFFSEVSFCIVWVKSLKCHLLWPQVVRASEDMPSQHIPVMNCLFAAQKHVSGGKCWRQVRLKVVAKFCPSSVRSVCQFCEYTYTSKWKVPFLSARILERERYLQWTSLFSNLAYKEGNECAIYRKVDLLYSYSLTGSLILFYWFVL